MKPELEARCTLFIENKSVAKDTFFWGGTQLHCLFAYIMASMGRRADQDVIEECKEILKQKTSVFSNFRGMSKMATIGLLALSDHRETKMDNLITCYDQLKAVLGRSEYMTIIANMLGDLQDPQQLKQIIEKTHTLYKRMKSEHPFLTSKEDSPYAALLALSDRDVDTLIIDMEQSYQLLCMESYPKDPIQSLSHILALSEEPPKVKCDKVVRIYDQLKKQGHTYGKHYELSTLGVFALLDIDVDQLVMEIGQVDDFLSTQKGFGTFGIGAKQRVMYAGMLVASLYTPNITSMQTAVMTGVLSMMIAQQVALCSVAACSAAASSADAS